MKTFISLLLIASLYACKSEKGILVLTTDKEEVTITPEQATISDDPNGGYKINVSSNQPEIQLEIGKHPSGSDLRVFCTYKHQNYTLSGAGNQSNNITVNNENRKYSVRSELNLKAVDGNEPLKINLKLPSVIKE